MRPGFEDYYEISKCFDERGCCLNCPYAKPGCLCYDCKCTNCLWYTPPEEYDGEKGRCDISSQKSQEFKKIIQREQTKVGDFLNE